MKGNATSITSEKEQSDVDAVLDRLDWGDIEESITDWRWRFTNLYHIKPADKRASILFDPKPEQWDILEAIYGRGEVRLAILKSRQLGFSTLLALIALDMAMWMAGFTTGIVDQTQPDSHKKLDKVYFAWKRLPVELKSQYRVESESKGEFAISVEGEPGKIDETSTIYAGTNARGGTHQLLWISEWGPIQVEDAGRSDKIADGALPSAEDGIVVVETTWRGGRTGRLYEEVVKPAITMEKNRMWTKADWKVYFFTWWTDPKHNFNGDASQITEDCLEYFYDLETGEEKIVLKDSQKLWYFKKAWVKGYKRFEEFPSIRDEMFSTPIEGAIYANQIAEARADGRVRSLPVDHEHPVHTSWDLGSPENLVVYYWQKVGFWYHLIDCDHDLHLTTAERVSHMNKKGYPYGVHLLPHDGSTRGSDALSFARKLKQAGLNGVKVIEREVHRAEEKRIGLMLDVFNRIVFNSDTLDDEGGALTALSSYRYKKSAKDGKITSEIVHDWANHHGNAFGYWGEALRKRKVPDAQSHYDRQSSAETPTYAPGRARYGQRQSKAQM